MLQYMTCSAGCAEVALYMYTLDLTAVFNFMPLFTKSLQV